MFFDFFKFRCPDCNADFEIAITCVNKRNRFACPSCDKSLPDGISRQMRGIISAIIQNWVEFDTLKEWTAHVNSSDQYPIYPEEVMEQMKRTAAEYRERQSRRASQQD